MLGLEEGVEAGSERGCSWLRHKTPGRPGLLAGAEQQGRLGPELGKARSARLGSP